MKLAIVGAHNVELRISKLREVGIVINNMKSVGARPNGMFRMRASEFNDL